MTYLDNTYSSRACLKFYPNIQTEKIRTTLGTIEIKHARNNSGTNQQLRWEVQGHSQTETRRLHW